MTTLNIVILVLVLGGLGLSALAVLLHKSLRIHKLLFAVYEEAVRARKDAESTYSQIEALLSLERHLRLEKPLPPLRGWAASPDFLLVIAEFILQSKPKCVLECSSGASTVVAARCLQLLGGGHVFSLEHSPDYAEKTRENLRKHGLEKWATVIDAPLISYPKYADARWYSLERLGVINDPVDLLIVDGPPQSTASLARLPALMELEHLMNAECALFLDDADREDEKEIVRRWLKHCPEFHFENMWCEKGCAKLVRSRIHRA